MREKIIVLLLGVLVVGMVGVAFFFNQKKSIPPSTQEAQKILPSVTLKEYSDPSGFTFNYPDNLSLLKNDTGPNAYADIQLTAKDASGSVRLKITDNKSTSIDEVVKSGKETTLGSLKAAEVKDENRILLTALDQGVLFAIEVALENQEDFWVSVYNTVRSNFSFTQGAPEGSSQVAGDSSDNVIFEGEEIIEE